MNLFVGVAVTAFLAGIICGMCIYGLRMLRSQQ
jgi:hypothetical protein